MKAPSNWSLVFFNDSVTPFGVVAYICTKVLHMTSPQAVSFANKINEEGIGEFGSFPKSIAEAKRSLIESRANSLGYPLKVEIKIIKKDEDDEK